MAFSLIGLALTLTSVLLLVWVVGFRSRSSPEIRSLAVLPLESLSGDEAQEYFADGMTDELIATLGQISALRVISRTSVMPYKRARKPLPEIARELNVDAVVEGTVMRSGGQVRITAQLIEARSDRHLWSETYQGDLSDTLTLQNKVARAIASQVQVNVNAQEQATLKNAQDRRSRGIRGLSQGPVLLEQEDGRWLEDRPGLLRPRHCQGPELRAGIQWPG